MKNPFRTPLASANIPRRELGHPLEGYAFPAPETAQDEYATNPRTEPLATHGTIGERFQSTNPEYAGTSNPAFLNNAGIVPSFSQLAPAPGSENLSAPRDAAGKTGTNRLYQSHGPVDGGSASEWSGKNAALRTPVVGNSGPVSGGRDGAQVAAQAYFAAQAAQYSQAASDAAMVSAL